MFQDLFHIQFIIYLFRNTNVNDKTNQYNAQLYCMSFSTKNLIHKNKKMSAIKYNSQLQNSNERF